MSCPFLHTKRFVFVATTFGLLVTALWSTPTNARPVLSVSVPKDPPMITMYTGPFAAGNSVPSALYVEHKHTAINPTKTLPVAVDYAINIIGTPVIKPLPYRRLNGRSSFSRVGVMATIPEEDSRSPLVGVGVMPTIPEEDSRSPFVGVGVMPTIPEEDSRSPFVGVGVMPTIPEEDSRSPFVGVGVMPTIPEEDSRSPFVGVGVMPTIPEEDYRSPFVGVGVMPTIPEEDSRFPFVGVGAMGTVPEEDFRSPFVGVGVMPTMKRTLVPRSLVWESCLLFLKRTPSILNPILSPP